MGWEAGLMGDLVVTFDGTAVAVGGARQQVLVAALALSPNQFVPTERLINLVWGDDAPNGARRTLQSSVSKLRSAFGPQSPLRSGASGYLIELDRTDVDLLTFEDSAQQAFALFQSDAAAAAERLTALAHGWRDPLVGVELSQPMAAVLAPFRELHIQVGERQCTALIDSGQAETAARILADMTLRNPTNEKLWFELARGLVALGRRNHALDAMQRAREALRSELGVDLSPNLARLEVEILDGATPQVAFATAPALRSDNLRPDSDEFVTRPEVDEIRAMLARASVVSIVGTGGIGKTRTARAVASKALADPGWVDGVWFVDLASLPAGTTNISTAISTAIGLGRQGVARSDESIADYFSGRDVLLILDNCEHVRSAVRGFVTDLFTVAPTTAVLATSRVRLGVSAEQVVPLGTLSQAAARDLFVARAAEVGAGPFPVDDVEGLCAALDNYPLAVEIAAARTRALSVREILDRLADQSTLASQRVDVVSLDDESATASEVRHASLQTALDWSLTQLEPRPRDTLQRATVFAGDFDLAAAEAILITDGAGEAEVLTDLGVLVEHHLLLRDHRLGRYRMLEPIRQALLADQALPPSAGRRHCDHFAREAQRIGAGVLGSEEASCWDRFECDRDHLRDAVRWAADGGHIELLELAMSSMALLALSGGETGPSEWAADALERVDLPFGDVPSTSLAAAAGWATAMRFEECDGVLDALEGCVTEPRLLAMMCLLKINRYPAEAQKWLQPMLDASVEAGDEDLAATARIRLQPDAAIAIADAHGNPSMRSLARMLTYAWLPSLEQPRNLDLVDDCFRLAVSSNNEVSLVTASVIRGTSLCRAGDVGRGSPFLLDSLERSLRRRSLQGVWALIEAIAGLLPVMEREPATSAMLWAAVDATDFAPFTRVLRHPERPIWVEAQLSSDELAAARAKGARLAMDAAARETRKAVERFT